MTQRGGEERAVDVRFRLLGPMEILVQGTSMSCCLIAITASITATDNRYASGAPGLATFQMSAAFDDFRVAMP